MSARDGAGTGAGAAGAAGADSGADAASGAGATAGAALVLVGARLPGVDWPVDVSIVDGLIAALEPTGSAPFADRLVASGASRTGLDGRWLVPGLWDNHVHFGQWAGASRRLNVSGADSAAGTAAIVRNALAGAASGELLVGTGFRDGLWPDRPTAALLDAVTGPHPVVLISGDLHCCWLNSAALARFGRAGHPDGVLREEDAFAVHRALDEVPPETVDEWAHDAARAAAARGVVGIVDLEMAWNADDWSRRTAAGHDLLRVEFGVYPQHLERAIAAGLSTGDAVGGAVDATGRSLVHVGPFKVITDGSLNTRTAYCFDEYPGLEGRADSRGLLTVPPAELRALLDRATGAGFVPAVHAIGDHANRLVLETLEQLGCGGSVEHAQLVSDADFGRFAAAGVVAGVQPEHAMDDRDVADLFWAGRTGRAFALASLLEAGATLAMGSDAPVAPLDPWITMSAAVGRDRDGRTPWHPEQRIPITEALAASARGRRALHVGEVADLAAVERDPFAASSEELRAMGVALTLLAGRATYSGL